MYTCRCDGVPLLFCQFIALLYLLGLRPMLTLHHLEYSQSFRIATEELGVEYELKKYDRDPQTRLAPDAYKSISPLGTAPVITDGDLVLAVPARLSTTSWTSIRSRHCGQTRVHRIAPVTCFGFMLLRGR